MGPYPSPRSLPPAHLGRAQRGEEEVQEAEQAGDQDRRGHHEDLPNLDPAAR